MLAMTVEARRVLSNVCCHTVEEAVMSKGGREEEEVCDVKKLKQASERRSLDVHSLPRK